LQSNNIFTLEATIKAKSIQILAGSRNMNSNERTINLEAMTENTPIMPKNWIS